MADCDKERKKSISCGTVVYRHPSDLWSDTEILLVKQFSNKDNWGIPKGHIEKNESFEECAIRETLEEAGIDVLIGTRLTDIKSTMKKEEKTVISFLAQQKCTREPRSDNTGSEVADARWFKVSNLPRIHIYQQCLISEVFEILRGRLSERRSSK